jgi:hypothetical protein
LNTLSHISQRNSLIDDVAADATVFLLVFDDDLSIDDMFDDGVVVDNCTI